LQTIVKKLINFNKKTDTKKIKFNFNIKIIINIAPDFNKVFSTIQMNTSLAKTITLLIFGICVGLPVKVYSLNNPTPDLKKGIQNELFQVQNNIEQSFANHQSKLREDNFIFESGLYKTLDGNWGLDNKEKETSEVYYKGLNHFKQLTNICSDFDKKYNEKCIRFISAVPHQQLLFKELFLLNRTIII
jgi:hypothetical protein